MTIGEIDIKDYFDQETLDALEQAFLEFDTSGDGSIGKDELRDLFAKLGKTLTKKQVDAIVREIDSDGNGEIDFEELCYLEIVMSGARPQVHLIDYKTFLTEKVIKQLEQWFSLNDMDDSGAISIDDALKIAEQQDVKVTMDDVMGLLSQVESAAAGHINFPCFCALWALITNAQKMINYREYLESEEVASYRAMFQEASGGKSELNRKQVADTLRNTGFVRVRRHLTRIWEEMAIDKKTMLDFSQFCIVIVRLMKRRKYREVNPETCTCANLYEEGFTVK
ncbi:CML12, partial [Symbiodinium natans]